MSPLTGRLYWKFPIDTDFIHLICQFHQSCDINIRVCMGFAPAATQQGMLGDLIVWSLASFWLQGTMAEGTVHGVGSAKKMYVIKQIKIRAVYLDMLPRPQLDLSGTPGLRPIGLGPGVGVTKPICSVPLFSHFVLNDKTVVTCMISSSYLAGVTAAERRRHLANMNMIEIIWPILLLNRKFP